MSWAARDLPAAANLRALASAATAQAVGVIGAGRWLLQRSVRVGAPAAPGAARATPPARSPLDAYGPRRRTLTGGAIANAGCRSTRLLHRVSSSHRIVSGRSRRRRWICGPGSSCSSRLLVARVGPPRRGHIVVGAPSPWRQTINAAVGVFAMSSVTAIGRCCASQSRRRSMTSAMALMIRATSRACRPAGPAANPFSSRSKRSFAASIRVRAVSVLAMRCLMRSPYERRIRLYA